MQKRVRIKDISDLSGVSPGTVDRVIHNRGKVSKKSREAVEKVLKEVNYRPNVHMSSLSLKRNFNVLVFTPKYEEGEYWESIHKGVKRALNEYENINIKYHYIGYNQYDIYECRKAYREAEKLDIDAAIIGAIFQRETLDYCKLLNKKQIPYVFVDSNIDGTFPLASFSSDQYTCGYLLAKLIHILMDKHTDIGIMQAMRVGNGSANSTILRKAGFDDYFKEKKQSYQIHRIPFSPVGTRDNNKLFNDFFQKETNVGGVVVLNSRGNIIADYLAKNNLSQIRLVCIDTTKSNIQALREGKIDFLIGQNSEKQGYLAMRSLIEHLIFKMPIQVKNLLPLDIITKETIDLHTEFNDLVYLNQYE